MSVFLEKQTGETNQTVFTEIHTKLDDNSYILTDLLKQTEAVQNKIFKEQDEELSNHVSLYTKEKARQITEQDYHFNFFNKGKCRNKTFSVQNLEHNIAKAEINNKLDVAVDELFKKIIVCEDQSVYEDTNTLNETLRKCKCKYKDLKSIDDQKLNDIRKNTSQIAKDAFNRLEDEYKEHAYIRFQKTFECHADFINSILYLNAQIEKMNKDSAQKFQKNILDYIQNIIDHSSDEKNIYLNGRYRDIQGAIDPKDKSSIQKLNEEKTALLITGILREDKNKSGVLEIDDSHTMPFPAFFGWANDPFKIREYKKDEGLNFSKNILDKNVLNNIKNEIDLFKNKYNEEEFIARSLSLITGLLLRISSETEAFPKFINSDLDTISESGQYKEQLGKAIRDVLKTAFSENKTFVENKCLVKANEPYFKETISHIIKETKNCHDILSKQKKCLDKKPATEKVKLYYKLSLICDLWIAIEEALKKACCEFTKDLNFWKIVQNKN